MHTNRFRRPVIAAVAATSTAAAIAASLAGVASPAGAATDAQSIAFGGNGYGSTATVGSLVKSGKTAYSAMCTTTPGTSQANKTAKVALGAVGYVGAVTSNVHGTQTDTKERSAASTHTLQTSLLAGVIQASAVTTYSAVTRFGSHYVPSGGSTFAGLSILGQTLPVNPDPNTVISLPGVGSVELNEQVPAVHHGLHSMTVTALKLTLNGLNPLGLPAGRVIVGRSTASLRTVTHLPTALAYATQINVAGVAGSGRTAAVYTPCGGTGGNVRTNNLAAVNIPNVATAGAATSTTQTTDDANSTTSTSQNTIGGVNLFGGVITLDALTTAASATRVGNHVTTSSDGTQLLGLEVGGQAIDTPPMGGSMDIPGLGTLYFGYSVTHRASIMVYGLRLVLGQAQSGLPAGAVVTIGAAGASVQP